MKALYKNHLVYWIGLAVSLFLLSGTNALAAPAYPTISGDNTAQWITNVTFEAINNDSVNDAGGYGNYLAIGPAVVDPGSLHTLSVTIKPETGLKISAFFDWNGDGDFTDPGEEIMVTPNIIQPPDPNSYTESVDVTIPPSASLIDTRMRVVVSFVVNDADPVPSSGTSLVGEAEDYTISISNGGSLDPIITATAGTNGTIAPAGAVVVTMGQNQVFAITSDANFYVEDVTVDGLSKGPVTTYSFSTVIINHTIHATFAPFVTHAITATGGLNGSVSPSGIVLVGENSDQSFDILADPGYKVADVLVDGGTVGNVSSYTFSNVTAAHTIAASFALDNSYPSVNSSDFSKEWISNVNFGTINNDSNAEGYGSFLDLSTEVQLGGEYPITVSIRPVANENISVYIDWNQDGDFVDAGEETMVATQTFLTGPHRATVAVPAGATLGTTRMRVVLRYFVPAVPTGDIAAGNSGGEAEDYTITVANPVPSVKATSGPNGSITPSGDIPIASGQDSTEFSISPVNPFFSISDVIIDGVSTGKPFPTTYTFLTVTVTHTIHVEFADTPIHIISATSGANGTISPTGQVDVLEGDNQVFTFTPDDGFLVESVVVDGLSIKALNSYTFTNVNTAHSLSVTFSLDPPFPWKIFIPAISHGRVP